MGYLIGAFLAALFGLSLVPGDVTALETSLAEQSRAGRVKVSAEVPAAGHVGDVDTLRIDIHDVDVKRIPVEALLPVPIPRSPKARIQRLVVVITQAHLDNTTASEVRFEARDLAYDLVTAAVGGELRVTTVGQQLVRVVLRNGDLDGLAKASFPELLDTRITFEGGRLFARAKVPVILAAFPVAISGTVAIEGGTKVVLRDAAIDTGRLQLAPAMKDTIAARLNPLIDLEKSLGFPLPVTWHSIKVTDGQCQLDGEVLGVAEPVQRSEFQPRARYLR
ncbi:MAG: hypothetical protein HZB16_03195 [Armatimonadetes bacterium]|nr:hypothetical protein [Armatimonadota bacterium]